MSSLKPGKFSTYHLNKREEIQGGALTITQRELIQNDRALVCDQIMTLQYDPEHSLQFLQQDAYLKAQLAVYNFILDRDEECQRAIIAGEDRIS